VAVAIFLTDQVTKHLIRSGRAPGQISELVPGFLDLTHVRNAGAAFGLFPGRQPIFVATSVVVMVVIAAYWRRAHPQEWPVILAMGAITAGAIGNLVDRITLGLVTDFLAFSFVDFPVFNVADIGIVTGVGILVLWLLFGPEPGHPVEPGHADGIESSVGVGDS
jgi:signal peptidase II